MSAACPRSPTTQTKNFHLLVVAEHEQTCSIPIIETTRLQPQYPPRIIHETDDFLVVEKPAFMAVHPTRPGESGTLWDALRGVLAYEIANGGQVSLINRLDRETSGLTLVAKHHESARHFSQLMMKRAFAKEYLAIVYGWPSAERWEMNAPLLRQGRVRPSPVWVKQCIHPAGAEASTAFETIQRFERKQERFAVVRAIPHTGRMHQIRVHLAESHHPIVGDKLYVDEACYLQFIETGWTSDLERRLHLSRQALHAHRLAVQHLKWTSDLPPELAVWLP